MEWSFPHTFQIARRLENFYVPRIGGCFELDSLVWRLTRRQMASDVSTDGEPLKLGQEIMIPTFK